MNASGTIHYLNADFDLRLRARSGRPDKPSLLRQVRELSWQALLGATDGDIVYTPVAPPDDFIEYLRKHGLEQSEIHTSWDASWDGEFAPYGWSDETIALNRELARPVRHPPLATAREVNSRRFALELERALGIESSSGAMVRSVDELERYVCMTSGGPDWIVKGQHGNSGLANRRIGIPLTDADRRFVVQCLEDDGECLVERRHDRTCDWSVVFDTPFERRRARIHETVCTAGGALIGALYDPDADAPGELYATAESVAARLESASYFGPVCMDA